MQLLENMGRVMASESILPSVDQAIAQDPPSVLMLMISADLHWRRKEWEQAIGLAKRALEIKPRHFHALSILVNAYGHLEQWDAAYPYARRLLEAKRPNWTVVKIACAVLGFMNLVLPKRRETYRRTMERCDEEARGDRGNLSLAEDLVAKHDAANDAVAV